MPKAEETQVIVELTQHTLHALRAVNGTVEAGGECALENKPALEALLDAVAPTRKAEGIGAAVLLWPGSSSWHLSSDTQALLDRSDEAVRSIAASLQSDPKAPMAYAVCGAVDGGSVTPEGTEQWILASSSLESMAKAQASLSGLNVVTDGVSVAAFASIGAVSSALRADGKGGAVALWDPGWGQSHLLLVTAKGVEAAVPCPVGMDAIFAAVQSALRLKFRGAGARLFFNDSYDFTECGPKIGAVVAAGFKEALGKLPPLANPPALACLGLTGKQSWFIREIAAAAGIPQWEPGLGKLAAELGIRFSDSAVEASLSAASVGLFQLLGGRIGTRREWIAEWVEAEAPPEEAAASAPPAEEEPEPVAEPEPEPVAETLVRPVAPPARAKPSLSIETSGGVPRMTRPTVSPRPATAPPMPQSSGTRPPVPSLHARPVVTPPAATPSFPTPQGSQPSSPASHTFPAPSFPTPGAGSPPSFPIPPRGTQPSFPTPQPAPAPSFPTAHPAAAPSFPVPGSAPRAPSFSNPGFPAPEAQIPEPAAALPTRPAAAQPGAGVRMGVPGGTTPPTAVTALPFEAVSKLKLAPKAGAGEPAPKSRVGFYVGILVAAALIFAAIAVVLEARLERAKANDLEQQEALAHHVLEQQLKDAEKAAKEEADRRNKELAAAIEATKKQTEEDTRRRVQEELEAERLAKLPGALAVATLPAGASVSIDGATPLVSPAKADGIAPGSHTVQISLAGYEPVQTTVNVKGSATANLGTVRLKTIYGSLDLSSSPDGLEFEVRAASDSAGKPLRTGRTPATIDDIGRGDYVVTFSRPGCRDHVAKVSIERGAKSRAETKYADGSLELTSDPSGASVSKDGAFLGTTPLVLHDLTPKLASFDLTLPGYDPTPISCEIPEGQTLKFSANLLRKDRVFKASEVKTMPETFMAPAPVLSASQRKTGGEVLLSLVVRRDGSVADVVVVRSTDDDIARRCKQAAEKWLFRAATAPDDRTIDVRIELPFKFPAPSR